MPLTLLSQVAPGVKRHSLRVRSIVQRGDGRLKKKKLRESSAAQGNQCLEI
jgi:hypothetical protein